MGPKKLTDDQKQALFDAWQDGPEFAHIKTFQAKRAEIRRLELSLKDISWDIQPYLNAQFQMIQDLKVPGRKAKCKCIYFILGAGFWGLVVVVAVV